MAKRTRSKKKKYQNFRRVQTIVIKKYNKIEFNKSVISERRDDSHQRETNGILNMQEYKKSEILVERKKDENRKNKRRVQKE